MAITALNVDFDMLTQADLMRLSHNLIQNDFRHNVTDYCVHVDTDGDADFLHVTGPEVPPGCDGCLKVQFTATPSAAAKVALDFPIGTIAANEEWFVVLTGRAAAAKTLSVQSYHHSAGFKDSANIVLGTTFARYGVYLKTTSAVNVGSLHILLGADADDVWLSDIQLYRVEETVNLPRFQSVSVVESSPIAVGSAIDGRFSWDAEVDRGMVDVVIVDPFVDSDMGWWTNKLLQPARPWSPGCQYWNGHFAETAESFWTASSCTVGTTATNALVGANAMEVAGETTTSAAPYAYRAVTTTCASRRWNVSGYAWVDTATVMTCPLSCYDGTTDHRAATIYSMTAAYPALVSHAFTAGNAATALTARARGIPSSTDAITWDCVKVEPRAYTPYARCEDGGLWALHLLYEDASSDYRFVVQGLRLQKITTPHRTGSFIMHTLSARGAQLIQVKE